MSAIDVTSPDERVTLGCFVDPVLKRALLERARANDRTLSAELRTAIRRHLNDALGQSVAQTTQTKDEE